MLKRIDTRIYCHVSLIFVLIEDKGKCLLFLMYFEFYDLAITERQNWR